MNNKQITVKGVADIMGEMVKEETEKPFHWFTLLGAIVEQGSDATKIEDEEDAKRWGEIINGGNPRELTSHEETKARKNVLISTTRITLSTSAISSTGTPVISSWKKIIENSQQFSPTATRLSGIL